MLHFDDQSLLHVYKRLPVTKLPLLQSFLVMILFSETTYRVAQNLSGSLILNIFYFACVNFCDCERLVFQAGYRF